MATYRNKETGDEFTSGNLALALFMVFVFIFTFAGALAAIPAVFGLITVAVAVWAGGAVFALYGTCAAYVYIRKTMKIDD